MNEKARLEDVLLISLSGDDKQKSDESLCSLWGQIRMRGKR